MERGDLLGDLFGKFRLYRVDLLVHARFERGDLFRTCADRLQKRILCARALLLIIVVYGAVLLGEIAEFGEQGLHALLERTRERLVCGGVLGGTELQFLGDGLPDFFQFARHALVHALHDHRLSLFVSFHVFHDAHLSSMRIKISPVSILHQIAANVNTFSSFFCANARFFPPRM